MGGSRIVLFLKYIYYLKYQEGAEKA